jgi:hypothetical protein
MIQVLAMIVVYAGTDYGSLRQASCRAKAQVSDLHGIFLRMQINCAPERNLLNVKSHNKM